MSDLAAALDRPDGLYPRPEQFLVIQAAARQRLRLSKIPCEGDGIERVEAGKVWQEPCLSCGGSGEVWPAELVEVVAKAMTSGPRTAAHVLAAVESWMEAGE